MRVTQFYDPFAGSGSVLFQSAVMNRNYIGFELNKAYIEMFSDYLKKNKKQAEKEYRQLQNLATQEEFKSTILNLRALKFGRVLVNELDKKCKIDLKVFVKVLGRYEDARTHIKVEYQLIGYIPEEAQVSSEIKALLKKPPLSKFGIEPKIKLLKKKNLDDKKFYKYTKTNSYSHTDLPASSSKVKVISEICVALNENDYN